MSHGMGLSTRTVSIKSASRANSDINVTPLVDVVLVLLIIFMVVTPLLEKDIAIQVPPTEKAEEPTEVPPDQLVVRLDASNKLFINADEITPDQYVEKLRARLEGRSPSHKVVFIMADDAAGYAGLVHVLDGARAAGAETLAMAADAPTAP